MMVKLVLLKKDGSTGSFKLPSTVTSIGRRQDCDFCLPLSMVSRRHCELSIDRDQVSLRDFGSRNGTFLNGQRIDEARVKAGDVIQIGPVRFVVQVDGQPSSFESYFTAPQDGPAAAESAAKKETSSSPSQSINSETTEILDSLPDDFDLESSIEEELGK